MKLYPETYGDMAEKYSEGLAESGVAALVNESKDISECNIRIFGVEIDREYYKRFKLADMEYHKNLLYIANQDAKLVLNKDPNLQSTRGIALRNLLYLFEKDDSIRNYRS